MSNKYYQEGQSVEFYDFLTSLDPAIRGDVEFYASFLHVPGRRVLELGCGTGRVAVALAARHHVVVGVDSSEPMLARAQAKIRSLNPVDQRGIRFLRRDMVTIDLPVRFHLIIAPFYTFNHLDGRKLRARALATMAKHLLPGGYIVIHAASTDTLSERRAPRRPGNVFHFEDTKERLEVTWIRNIDERRRHTAINVEYGLFAADGTLIESSAHSLSYWWFTDGELERSAIRAGLVRERTLTSFEGASGRERIYVLRKPIAEPRL